jgi:crotonobetainyl-CoA:carnitine CoA-transferase CaiB-like acyl-CoA transferase
MQKGTTMTPQPLAGIRILEIGGYISLPFATSILCSLGAEVVKVERPVVGEDFRRSMNEASPYFRQYNSGKRSLAVDLKTSEGIELVKSLVPRFDVVLENLRPGKLAALGLGPEVCRELRADIVYGSVTGFGSSGPLADRPAYDTIGHAIGGLYSLFSDEGKPQLAGGLSADLITGISTATGVMSALIGRLKTGQPQHVETSIMEAVSLLTVDGMTQSFELGHAPSRTSRHPQAQNFCIQTADDDFVAIHLSSSQKFWQSLCRAMDRLDLLEDEQFAEYRPRESNYFKLVPIVASEFAKRPREHWERVLTEHDVPFAPVLSLTDYQDHEQVQHLEMFDKQEDGLNLLRAPWMFDGERPHRSSKSPRVGADTLAVASEVYSEQQLRPLIEAGVLSADVAEDPAVKRPVEASV